MPSNYKVIDPASPSALDVASYVWFSIVHTMEDGPYVDDNGNEWWSQVNQNTIYIEVTTPRGTATKYQFTIKQVDEYTSGD